MQMGRQRPVRPVEQPCLQAVYLRAAELRVTSSTVQPVLRLKAPVAGRDAREIGALFCRAPALVPAPAAVRKVLPEFLAQKAWALPQAIGLEASQSAVLPLMVPVAGRGERAVGALFCRAPALFHAPADARQVLPAGAVRLAEASLQVAQHGVQQPAAGVAVRPDAAGAAVAAPRDVAAAVAAEPAAGAGLAALRVVPAGRPSAAAWASRQDLLPPWPALPPPAPTARGMGLSPIAWPQGLSWQAALVVSSSCRLRSSWEFVEGR